REPDCDRDVHLHEDPPSLRAARGENLAFALSASRPHPERWNAATIRARVAATCGNAGYTTETTMAAADLNFALLDDSRSLWRTTSAGRTPRCRTRSWPIA